MGEDSEKWPEGFDLRYPVLEAIARKCELFGLDCDIQEFDDVPGHFGPAELELWIGEEGAEYGIPIEDGPHALFALSVPFELYKEFHWRGTSAIYAPTLGVVECLVVPYEGRFWWQGRGDYAEEAESTAWDVLHSLGLVSYDDDGESEALELGTCVHLDAGEASITLGACSNEWAVWDELVRNPQQGESASEAVVRRALTLRIEGVEVPDEARASDILDRLGNATLFEIDLASGIGLRFRHATHWPYEDLSLRDGPSPGSLTTEGWPRTTRGCAPLGRRSSTWR